MTLEKAYGMTVTMMRRVKIKMRTVGIIDLISWKVTPLSSRMVPLLLALKGPLCPENIDWKGKFHWELVMERPSVGLCLVPGLPRHCRLPVWCSSLFLQIPDPSGDLTLKWQDFSTGWMYVRHYDNYRKRWLLVKYNWMMITFYIEFPLVTVHWAGLPGQVSQTKLRNFSKLHPTTEPTN